MSSEVALRVQGLGKCYQIYKRPRDRLIQGFLRGKKQLYKEFWALNDVSFEARNGETLGIIGRNGSGKSTLLQIIANTLEATSGEVEVTGRIAALLELGAGFNSEFTGRENVFINAAIMGLSRVEIEERFEDIASFADIGEFIEQPVKIYSSGMYVRLAFAVAATLSPDILIVDEALSVGDIRFQRKCFRRLEELKANNTTILFVTHATEAVLNHCDRAIFLDEGSIREIGETRYVVNSYITHIMESTKITNVAKELLPKKMGESNEEGSEKVLWKPNYDPDIDGAALRRSHNTAEYRWGNQKAKIIDYRLECDGEIDPVACRQRSLLELEITVCFFDHLEKVIYGLLIRTVDGIQVFGSNSRNAGLIVGRRRADSMAVVSFKAPLNLIAGDYFISIGVASEEEDGEIVAIDRRYDMIHIKVLADDEAYGIALLDLQVEETVKDCVSS